MYAVTELRPGEAAEVLAAAAEVATAGGAPALNEDAMLSLSRADPAISHLLLRSGSQLAGYAHLDESGPDPVGQLFVRPAYRKQGLGAALARALAERAPGVHVWAAGNSPAARALAARTGFRPARQLVIMQRALTGDAPALPDPEPAPGITIRSFRPGADDAEWLALNAAAFAAHREQGAMTAADLAARMAEPWFDPGGFFVAVHQHPRPEEPTELVGFHWTKRHPADVGEVYVLGVSPGATGHGLGKALLLTGLHHLRRQGDTMVKLYVEADNERASRLYRGYGFAEASRDVMYAAG